MKNSMKSKKTKHRKIILSPEQKRKAREITNHKKMVQTVFSNIGFERLTGVAGVNFVYDGRETELDDVFVLENVILLVEYTTEKNPTDHLLKKSIVYDKINRNSADFIRYMLDGFPRDAFKQYYQQKISKKYSELDQLQVRIIYCSRYNISEKTRNVVNDIFFLDYNVLQYFNLLTKAIKRSAIYEFLDFLGIIYRNYANNLIKSSSSTNDIFAGYVLPESKSSYKHGYKIISFYIDADSLLRRAYVLRQESWRSEDTVRLYQRMLDSSKITNMRKYLQEEGRVFVNNIIATISSDDIAIKKEEYDPVKQKLITTSIDINEDGDFLCHNPFHVENILIEISDKYNIIGIVDGQHRLFAYHEGTDMYETKISHLRKQQNLLLTCILYPHKESSFERNRFEANLFLEINKNQKKLQSALQQEIELIVSPFSTTAIGKEILKKLNSNGPLEDKLMQSAYDIHKISTASVVSYGLKPLIKLDENAPDSLFRIWDHPNKLKLKEKDCVDDELRMQYVNFCTEKIRDIMRAFKEHLAVRRQWEPYSATNKDGVLGVVLINGILNVLRILVSKEELSTPTEYSLKLKGVESFDYRSYTSSQYRKMGEAIYNRYWNN